jgi:hypothetical protein
MDTHNSIASWLKDKILGRSTKYAIFYNEFEPYQRAHRSMDPKQCTSTIELRYVNERENGTTYLYKPQLKSNYWYVGPFKSLEELDNFRLNRYIMMRDDFVQLAGDFEQGTMIDPDDILESIETITFNTMKSV